MATTNPRHQGRPGRGDFTGRTKEKTTKEAREADQERSAELTMASARQRDDEEHGVFDPKTNVRIDSDGIEEVNDDDAFEEAPAQVFGFSPKNEKVHTGKESPEEIAPAIEARKTFTPPPVELAHSAMVHVRVDEDIEDMTFGMVNGEPNNFTFYEGLVYEVPYALAEHLNDLGLIRQYITR